MNCLYGILNIYVYENNLKASISKTSIVCNYIPYFLVFSLRRLFFFLFVRFGAYGSLYVLALRVHVYFNFLHEWFHMLRTRFLELQKFFLFFLCVSACNRLYYTNSVILARVLLVFPIQHLKTFCTHEAKSRMCRGYMPLTMHQLGKSPLFYA